MRIDSRGSELTRISHKILKKSDEMLCEMHRECARDHYQVDKARAIRDEDPMTDRSNFSRVCEKCGLKWGAPPATWG